jgi:quinol monooxygenase YgiN
VNDSTVAYGAVSDGFKHPPDELEENRMVTCALVVSITAKSGMEDEVSDFLAKAVGLANDEAGTPVWFALRSSPQQFWIVDAFPGAAERQAHLEGPIAAALMANASRLLASPPEIHAADVLASKLP